MDKDISQSEFDSRIFETMNKLMPGVQELIEHGAPIVHSGWRPGIHILGVYAPSEKSGAQIVEYMAGPIKISRSFQPLYSDLALPLTYPRLKSHVRPLLGKHIQITISLWYDELDAFDGETYGWLGPAESEFSYNEMKRIIDPYHKEDADFMARRKRLFDALLIAALTL